MLAHIHIAISEGKGNERNAQGKERGYCNSLKTYYLYIYIHDTYMTYLFTVVIGTITISYLFI